MVLWVLILDTRKAAWNWQFCCLKGANPVTLFHWLDNEGK
uniref:Uncharacterized protein n=1 Tax=Rhizophora mucronata TaxID=61149 RepID=A0A2P2IH25_RHIMU